MSAEKNAALPARAVGFDVHLSGASLWDLVQMECQARVRRVFQVRGEGGVGFLYLAAGRVVHAAVGRITGQAAALEILSWSNGSFEPCERTWPPAPTIEVTHEALILEAARRRDEAINEAFDAATTAPKLLPFPGRGAVDAALDEIEELEIWEEGTGDMRTTYIDPPPGNAGSGSAELAKDFPIMLRLSASGAIVRNHGGSEEQGEAVAYAQRLVTLAGELLGLDAFTAMEAVFSGPNGGGRWFLFAEPTGDTVALRPRPEANLSPLRERLGL